MVRMVLVGSAVALLWLHGRLSGHGAPLPAEPISSRRRTPRCSISHDINSIRQLPQHSCATRLGTRLSTEYHDKDARA